MKLMHTMTALAFAAMTTACGNTADGAKKDADVAAEKTAEAASNTAEAVSGAMETSQVKTAIMADTRVDAGDINVDTDEGKKTVTLKGSVKTAEQKKIAEDIATEKSPGYTVVNELMIKP